MKFSRPKDLPSLPQQRRSGNSGSKEIDIAGQLFQQIGILALFLFSAENFIVHLNHGVYVAQLVCHFRETLQSLCKNYVLNCAEEHKKTDFIYVENGLVL